MKSNKFFETVGKGAVVGIAAVAVKKIYDYVSEEISDRRFMKNLEKDDDCCCGCCDCEQPIWCDGEDDDDILHEGC